MSLRDEFAGVTAAAQSGTRIGVLSGGPWFANDGGPSTAWVDECGGSGTPRGFACHERRSLRRRRISCQRSR